MSQPFPCPLELTVASALLLLSTTPTSFSPQSSGFRDDKSFEEESSNVKCCRVTSLSLSDSKSCSSSIHGVQVSRKSRSKIHWSTCDGQICFGKVSPPSTTGSVSKVTSTSCVSSSITSSSSVSSARSRYRSYRRIGSKHIRRQAEAILKFLSGDPRCSEVKIRQALGDSPDTSKALRMLLKQDEVKRSGTGGRQDPYVYMLA